MIHSALYSSVTEHQELRYLHLIVKDGTRGFLSQKKRNKMADLYLSLTRQIKDLSNKIILSIPFIFYQKTKMNITNYAIYDLIKFYFASVIDYQILKETLLEVYF